jgi:hypothetical protein
MAVCGLDARPGHSSWKQGGARGVFDGYRVRYTTSAELLDDLTAPSGDRILPRRVRYYGRVDWLIIDEFGFDKLELCGTHGPGLEQLRKLSTAACHRSPFLQTGARSSRTGRGGAVAY